MNLEQAKRFLELAKKKEWPDEVLWLVESFDVVKSEMNKLSEENTLLKKELMALKDLYED